MYQASGNAFRITNFFDDLHSNLSNYGKDVRRHLLNGMSYEIYFDSKAHLRRKFKTHKYEEVLSELLSGEGNESRRFICNQLEDFEQKVFYVPDPVVTRRNISIDYTYDYSPETDDITILVPMNQQLLRYAN